MNEKTMSHALEELRHANLHTEGKTINEKTMSHALEELRHAITVCAERVQSATQSQSAAAAGWAGACESLAKAYATLTAYSDA